MLAACAIATSLSCAPSGPVARTLDPNADVVVPYSVAGGGVIRLIVRPRYPAGQPIKLEVDVIAGSAGIRGPLSVRVMSSGFEGEKVVRTFGPSSLDQVDIAPNATGHTTVTWDAKDDAGNAIGAETYSLSLDFDVGGASARLGSVIQVVRP